DSPGRADQRSSGGFDKQAITATYHSFSTSVQPPGETEARRPAVLLGKTQARGNAVLRSRQNRRITDGPGEIRVEDLEGILILHDDGATDAFAIDDGNVIRIKVGAVEKLVPEHRVVFPPQTVVQRQLRRRLPIVLHIKGE